MKCASCGETIINPLFCKHCKSTKTRSCKICGAPTSSKICMKFLQTLQKHKIRNEEVKVNGEIETRNKRKLHAGDKIEVSGQRFFLKEEEIK